jgi:dipeptidyl aminopeptidase/acylaminoacyl peptidase
MRFDIRFSLILCLLMDSILVPTILSAQTTSVSPMPDSLKRAMVLEDMFRVKRVSDPQISPDGQYVAFVVGEVNKPENRVNNDIWLVETHNPASARKIVASPKSDNRPRWSPNGKTLSFISSRTGTPQIYTLALIDILAQSTTSANIAVSGKEQQMTNISTGAAQQRWSPDGSMIAFVSSVFPEFSTKPFAEADRLHNDKTDAADASKIKARVFDKLLYRHWDSWTDGTRQHIFVMLASGGEPRNLTPGECDAVPNADTFSAGDDYDWSSDSKEIAYTASPVPVREEAWTTNYDIFTVNVQTGARKQVTTNPAADVYPRYSPDGKLIAFRAQQQAGFEADRWQLMTYDRASGTFASLTKEWDYSVQQFEWMPGGKQIVLEAEENAETPLWLLPLEADKKGVREAKKLVSTGSNSSISIASDGTICFAQAMLTSPAEVATLKMEMTPKPVNTLRRSTAINAMLLDEFALSQPEKIYYLGAKVKNQAWLIRPPKFDPAKKYPVVFLIHGGPQGAWGNSWSYRWNPQIWAAQGYIVVAPNPTGSTGFGQEFVNGVSRDWGGKPYLDIMKCADHVLATYPFADAKRMALAGASYGGYMANWIATQTDRFATIVSHCGIYNFASMYGTTDEIWFEEWEHGKPWEASGMETEKHSPHTFIQNVKTPMLIIHNGNDFRVPLQEGMQMFTALQRRGIPSKFLYIPDEGHWVLKPQNSELWHTTIFGWLAEYLKK